MTFSSFSIFNKIAKLQATENYLEWKWEITKVLQIIKFWIFIWQLNKPSMVTQKPAVTRKYKRTYNVLQYNVNEVAFDEIEYYTNAFNKLTLLKSIFKSKRVDFLYNVLQHLVCLKLIDGKSPVKYIFHVQCIVNKLHSFSLKFLLDENFSIYCFQLKQRSDHFI